MLRDIIDDFCAKYPVDVRITLSYSNNDAEIEMYFRGTLIHRDFTVCNFLPTAEEEVYEVLGSLYQGVLREVEDYLNTQYVDVTKLGWMKAHE